MDNIKNYYNELGLVNLIIFLFSFFNLLGIIHYAILLPIGINTKLNIITSKQELFISFFSYVSPLLMIIFLYFWIFRPLINVIKEIKPMKIKEKGMDKFSKLLLIFSIYLSITAALYPYFPSINPNNLDFGVDVPSYIKQIESVTEGEVTIFDVTEGSKSVFFFFLIVIQKITHVNNKILIRYTPLILNPLIVIAIWYLSYKMYKNYQVSSWAAFLTSVGYKITIGMFSYFLTNLFALILVWFSISMLIISYKNSQIKFLSGSIVLGLFLIFTHPWTFVQYIFPFLPFFIYILINGKIQKDNNSYVIIYVFSIIMMDIFKTVFLKKYGGITSTTTISNGLIILKDFWYSNIYSFHFLYDGYLSNIIILLFAIFSIYMINQDDPWSKYFLYLTSLTSVIYFITNSTIKTRLLYNLPLEIFASLGLYYISNKLKFYSNYFFKTFILTSLILKFFYSLNSLV